MAAVKPATNGRGPSIQRTAVAPMSTFGVGGTVVYGGYIQSIEKDSRLAGLARWKTYSDLLANVSVVALGVRHFLNLAAKCDWTFQPADDSRKAEKVAEFITSVFKEMETPWHRVVRRAAMHRFYGFSIHEWTAMRRADGRLGLRDVEVRPQPTIEKWDLDNSGDVLGMVQRSPQTGEEIYLPREKLLYLVEDSLVDSPEGLGIFRHLVGEASALQRYEMLEGFGYETDLRGIPVARAPLSAMAAAIKAGELDIAKRDSLLAPINEFITGHVRTPMLGILLDSQVYQTSDESSAPSTVPLWSMELMKGSATALPDVARTIERKNVTIARLLGIEHLLMGADGKGSLALSKDKTGTFGLLVDSTLKEIKEQVSRDLIKPVLELNGIAKELAPEPEIETVQSREITDITAALRDMAQAGAMLAPDDPVMDEVRRLLGLRSKTKVIDTSLLVPRVPDPNPEQQKKAPLDGTNEGGE